MQKPLIDLTSKVHCPYAMLCTGCQLLDLTYGEQLQDKKSQLLELMQRKAVTWAQEPEILSAGSSGLRDRLDFSLQGGRLGLYGKDSQDIVDLEICAQLSPALQAWLTEFRQFQWPVEKGSIRLRVGPQGQKAAWLDFANIDIKKILDEKTLLQKLQSVAFVEIGQRRKVPVWNGTEFKLHDPQLNVWFQTWMNDVAVDLYCHVASFTQPSLAANRLIAGKISSWVSRFPSSRLIEFGSGIGNLTFPALASADSVTACEIDALSLEGLEKSLAELPASLARKKEKIKIHRGDFQKKIVKDFSEFDGVLANPPRSGLMNFLNPLGELQESQRPQFFIYMSCFPESMAVDLAKLKNYGYEISEWALLDQFPQSHHYEVLALLQRK